MGIAKLVSGRYPAFNNYQNSYAQASGSSLLASAAGERVDEWSVLGVSAVIACVSLLADTIAALPLRAFQIIDGKRKSIPLPAIIADPDPESNTFELVHQIVTSMALHGNTYIHKAFVRGEIAGLLPLHPYQMQVQPNQNQTGRLYRHNGNEMDANEILHMRWMTPAQSLVGVSPIVLGRNIFGLALAMDKYLAQFYAEGATPSSVIEIVGKLSPDQATIIRDNFERTHRKHRRTAVLSDGAKLKQVTGSAADQQMIETREQIVRDVARVFKIPSHLIGASGDNQTYQNVEQASLNFLTHTILPWLRRIEIGLSTVLPAGTDIAFDTSSLLRADALTRAKVSVLKIAAGSENPNEARADDGRDPYDGGEVFHQALPGSLTAGGLLPELGTGSDNNLQMGVVE